MGVRVEYNPVTGDRRHAAPVFGQVRHRPKLIGNMAFGIGVAPIQQLRHAPVKRGGFFDALGAVATDRSFAHEKVCRQANNGHERDDQNPCQGYAWRPPNPDDAGGECQHDHRVYQQVKPVRGSQKSPDHRDYR